MSCRSWLAMWTVDGAILVVEKKAAETEEYCWEEHYVFLLQISSTSRAVTSVFEERSGGGGTSGPNKDRRKECLDRSHHVPQAKQSYMKDQMSRVWRQTGENQYAHLSQLQASTRSEMFGRGGFCGWGARASASRLKLFAPHIFHKTDFPLSNASPFNISYAGILSLHLLAFNRFPVFGEHTIRRICGSRAQRDFGRAVRGCQHGSGTQSPATRFVCLV
jgi:hypothetical protein